MYSLFSSTYHKTIFSLAVSKLRGILINCNNSWLKVDLFLSFFFLQHFSFCFNCPVFMLVNCVTQVKYFMEAGNIEIIRKQLCSKIHSDLL